MPIDTSSAHLKRRRTKIVATLGPASADPAVVARLIEAGVDVFRLNMSHGEHASHRAAYQAVRQAAERAGAHVGVLADLCGPKIRVGVFAGGGLELREGTGVVVTSRDVVGGPGLVPSQYRELPGDVHPGDRILLDDGALELRVETVDGLDVACVVVRGGLLRDRKGMNLPGVAVSAPSLTDKDRADARFALELGVDLLALSFVRRAADVLGLRELVAEAGGRAGLIAKVEKPEALADIEGIVDASDGIMVARGDLGVELPPEVVPIAQSQLVDLARARRKPVIVATQMLESMVNSARPTRAEVSDVAQAVMSGADAVMLSAETASGAHPVEAVAMMDRVARSAEGYQWRKGAFRMIAREEDVARPLAVGDAVARATGLLSRDLMVRCIMVVSRRGATAAMVSSARPQAPVLAASDDPRTCRTMNLLWGVVPVRVGPHELDYPDALARRLARETGLAAAGQPVLVVRGFSADPERNVPTLAVVTA